jgi:hypothetical protein
VEGAIHFVCTGWRQVKQMFIAGEEIYGGPKELCVWIKSAAGKGSLYGQQHELIFVFKVGRGAHVHNVTHGRHSRHRTNVWDYGQNATTKGKVGPHSTVKPVAMIADAIRDCSTRGGVIIDPFAGCGTTLIAAEQTQRRARMIERNPVLVDLSIERWQKLTGRSARHAESGRAFERNPTQTQQRVTRGGKHV